MYNVIHNSFLMNYNYTNFIIISCNMRLKSASTRQLKRKKVHTFCRM